MHSYCRRALSIALAVSVLFAAVAARADPVQDQELPASDGATGDWSGLGVSLSGDTAIAGAQGHDGFTGSALIFNQSTFNPGDVFRADGSTTGHFTNVTGGGDFSSVAPLRTMSGRSAGQIAWSHNLGTAYVTLLDESKVIAITPDGMVADFAWGLTRPTGLVMTAAGRLLVATHTDGSVYDITAGGDCSAATPWAWGLVNPRNILELPTHQLMVAEQAGEVTDITAGGSFSGATPYAYGLSSAQDIVADPSGHIFVSMSSNGVQEITGGGDFSSVAAFAWGQQRIFGLTIDSGGRLLGNDYDDAMIFDLTAGGDFASASPWAWNLTGCGETGLDTVPDWAADNPPVADAGGAYGGLWGDVLHLDGSGSTDPDGDTIDAWAWDLDNDGLFGADDAEPTTETHDFTIPPKGTGGWENWTTRTIGLMVNANSVWSDPAYSEILVSPEPATMLLVGGALLALVRRRRRRR